MLILGLPASTLIAWLLAVAFLGAGIANVAGSAASKAEFARWGYPRGWNVVTGGLEALAAALIATPPTRIAGLALGTAICVAAVATVARHKAYAHLPAGLALTALSALDLALLAA
jgi:hypothetical protein